MAARKKLRSIFTDDLEHCYFKQTEGVEIHHIFFGNPYFRKHSEEDGFIIPLSPEEHRGNDGVHFNRRLDLDLKQHCQRVFEEEHTRDEFIQRYGKSYL